MALKDLVKGGLAALTSPGFTGPVQWDEATGAYINTSVYRGFPMGTPGSGGFGLDTAGGFIDLRINNNWMRPIRRARGSFWAVACQAGKTRSARILRRAFPGDDEFSNIPPIAHTRFVGDLPHFEQRFTDPGLPIEITVRGFSPLIPHDERASTAPLAAFDIEITTESDAPVEVCFLFSWENILGRGGTGNTGVDTRGTVAVGTRGRLRYDTTAGNHQSPVDVGTQRGLVFETAQRYPAGSHRQSVLGRYLLVAERSEDLTLDYVTCWDAHHDRPALLSALAKGKDLRDLKADDDARTPAGAVAVRGEASRERPFKATYHLVWWAADHTTEANAVQAARSGVHQGQRVGHRYEHYFGGPHAVARYAQMYKEDLRGGSKALGDVLRHSTLPPWLRRALTAAADSVITNTIIPKGGDMHTLEAMDWKWFFGGLTGTNDQRISAHPYTATFLTELDRREVDLFRRLAKGGAVPHGNGNCDLALGTSDVPYGEPMDLAGALKAEPWPDLTLSSLLQTHRLYRSTGDDAWMRAAWPDLVTQLRWLMDLRIHGIPQGGSTYDTLRFPGTFSYTATLWLAALKALLDLAPTFGPEITFELERAQRDALQRVDDVLWDPKGFYRSCAERHTLFTGALAGDWFARWAGLGPVLPPDRVRGHLGHVHRTIIVPALARARQKRRPKGGLFETVEASFDGTPRITRLMGAVKVHGYIWQVISYYAIEAIYLGLVPEALSTCQLIYEHIWRGGWPWSADLYGEAGPVYMTHPVLWAMPNALAGAALDVPRGRLSVAPKPHPDGKTQRLPVFFPGFWAMLEGSQAKGWTLKILKTFGAPVQIKALSFGGGAFTPLREPVTLRTGLSWPISQGSGR